MVACKNLAAFGDDRLKGDNVPVLGLLAAVGEDLLHETPGPDAGFLDFLQAHAGRVAGVRVGDGQLGVAQDGGEDVVEVMGDAAGQLADGFQLLRLPELRRQFQFAGHIAFDRHIVDNPALVIPDGRNGGVLFVKFSVLAFVAKMAVPHLAAFEHIPQ
jgi:hypothetical protein